MKVDLYLLRILFLGKTEPINTQLDLVRFVQKYSATSDTSVSAKSSENVPAAGARKRYVRGHLFKDTYFLLTSISDEQRADLTKNILQHGGKVFPTIAAVEKACNKRVLSQQSGSSDNTEDPLIITLADATMKVHRRAKYQYAV